MKKMTVFFLILIMLCSGIPVSFAENYRDQVLPLLAEKLQVSPDAINLEGSLMELTFSGKRLWVGRYYTGEMAADKPLVDEPDTPVSSEDALIGTVYFDIDAGKLLSDEEVALYFEEEEKLRQAEYERLADQSGKIDPFLYGKILQAAAGDLFEVIIWLRYQETDSLKEAINEILKDYPDLVEKGMVPPELGGGSSSLEPLICIDSGEGGGVSGAEPGKAGDTAPAVLSANESNEATNDGEFHILPYPAPDPSPDDKGTDERGTQDDIEWARYEEMMNRLAAVRLEGYSASLAAIEQTLGQMGVPFEVSGGNTAVLCTLTAEQLQSLKDADYIESISENVEVYALDGVAEREDLNIAPVMDYAEKQQSAFPWFLLIPAVLLVAGCAAVYYCHRKKKTAGNL